MRGRFFQSLDQKVGKDYLLGAKLIVKVVASRCMKSAEDFADDCIRFLNVVVGQPLFEYFTAFCNHWLAHLAQSLTQASLCLGGYQMVLPFGLRRLGLGGQYFSLVAATKCMAQRNKLVVHLARYAVHADFGMQVECQVKDC